MPIKKSAVLFALIAIVSVFLLVFSPGTGISDSITPQKSKPPVKCCQQNCNGKSPTPWNMITQSIFHLCA